MNISDECKKALIEHGVLMNGGVPAGHEMMNKPFLRVAFMGPDFTIADLERKIGKETNFLWGTKDVQTEFNNNIDFEKLTREALGYWYSGNVEFVDVNEEGDIYFFAFQGAMPGGIATFPINDHPEAHMKSYPVSIVGLQMPLATEVTPRDENLLFQTLRHEFGHTFGVIHPEGALGYAEQESTVCGSYKKNIEEILYNPKSVPIMSYGGSNVSSSFYDEMSKKFIQDGSFPLISKPQ